MENYTITEKYELPSKGLLYDNVPKTITLRSMTTEEEMRRLSQHGSSYQKLCDIIDKCIIEDLPISSYDMCLGDYQGLLYKLRTISYGSECVNENICPYCGKITKSTINLDDLITKDFNGFDEDELKLELPRSKKRVVLKLQTPRILDQIDKDIEEFNTKAPENDLDLNLLFTLKYSIQSVEDTPMDSIKKELFIRKLPVADMNKILNKIIQINDKVGVDTRITVKCSNSKCGRPFETNFRINTEFFGPSDY